MSARNVTRPLVGEHGEQTHSSAGFTTRPYLRFWFQKNGRR
jgi:hypothetical protein